MASRVEFSVSATPIYTATNAEMNSTDVIAKDVGRTVAGSGSTTVTWGSTIGFTAGVPTYVDADSVSTIEVTSAKFVYFKNTGFTLNGTALGAATSSSVEIVIGAAVITHLGPGQAIIIPFSDAAISQTYTIASSSGSIAVEYFWTA